MTPDRDGLLMLVLCIATCGMVLWLTAFRDGSGPSPLRVLVASSLVDAVGELADRWTVEAGRAVEVVPGGSNHLAAQVRDGAPADAFLSADETLLHGLREELGELGHLTDDPVLELARNHLVVARHASAPERSPADLHDPALVLVACAPEVPCGAATVARFGDLPVDSLEPSARATVARLLLDEADLGVVYATDVVAHPDLVSAWPQEPACPCVDYAAAALSPDGRAFVDFAASPEGRAVLETHGFASGILAGEGSPAGEPRP
ncbi:MAG: molybdate-binding protein [Acidimicrobiaceae bacterium]|nr:molybdate-binding protein [Acidimicrobiaceae bacterium]MBR12728.1 molybdate-binding protein [Acidimicrobiaceae bacterium]